MSNTIRNLAFSLLVFSCCTATNILAAITYENTYSYSQVGFSTSYGNTIEDTPLDINTTEATPISSVQFRIQSLPSTPYELKAKAGLTVDIDQRGTQETWETFKASATAKSTLVDFGIVEQIGDPTSGSGLIEFNWVVTGASDILFDASGPNGLLIKDLKTLGVLTSDVPGSATETFLNDQADNRFINGNGSNPKIESFVPVSSEFQRYVVPWSTNFEVPVFFELVAQAELDVSNLDAAGFHADIDADFSNTATLESVVIYDADGNLLNDAALVGQDGFDYVSKTFVGAGGGGGGGTGGGGGMGAVPEPSTYAIWLGLMGLGAIGLRNQRRYQRRI